MRFLSRRLSSIFVLALALVFCQVVHASEAVRAFNDADAELNATYQKLLATFRDGRERALFVQSQRSWIKYRDDSVAFYATHYPASKGGLFLNEKLTIERTNFLKALLRVPPTKDLVGPDPSDF